MIFQIVKEIFLLVGSFLGFIAFFKTMLDPVLVANKQRWEDVKKRIDEVCFQNLEHEVYVARRIDAITLRKLECFIMDIGQRREYLQFGPLLERRYGTHLDNLR